VSDNTSAAADHQEVFESDSDDTSAGDAPSEFDDDDDDDDSSPDFQAPGIPTPKPALTVTYSNNARAANYENIGADAANYANIDAVPANYANIDAETPPLDAGHSAPQTAGLENTLELQDLQCNNSQQKESCKGEVTAAANSPNTKTCYGADAGMLDSTNDSNYDDAESQKPDPGYLTPSLP
jgi:hypothetical protein